MDLPKLLARGRTIKFKGEKQYIPIKYEKMPSFNFPMWLFNSYGNSMFTTRRINQKHRSIRLLVMSIAIRKIWAIDVPIISKLPRTTQKEVAGDQFQHTLATNSNKEIKGCKGNNSCKEIRLQIRQQVILQRQIKRGKNGQGP